MCVKGNTIRSSRRDKHANARPYVREKNSKYNFGRINDYVADFNSEKDKW